MSRAYSNYADIIDFTRASTGTYLDSDGLLKTASVNTPRIEYDADGNLLGLLVEESRTNLWLGSENMGSSAFGGAGASVTADSYVAPDGNQTADLITANSGIVYAYKLISISGTTNIPYTVSVWVKAVDANTSVGLRIYEAGGASANYFHDSDYFPISTTEWTRVTFTATLQQSDRTTIQGIFRTDSSSNLIAWGAQLEAGSFPTSYIPTSGSTATRSADVASLSTSAFGYNQDAITVLTEFVATSWDGSSGYNRVVELDDKLGIFNDGGLANATVRYRFDNDSNVAQFGPDNLSFGTYGSAKTMSKVAFALKNNDAGITKDGKAVITDSSGDYDLELISTLNIGNEGPPTTNFLNGHIKTLKVYPRRLTNAQLQALTS